MMKVKARTIRPGYDFEGLSILSVRDFSHYAAEARHVLASHRKSSHTHQCIMLFFWLKLGTY